MTILWDGEKFFHETDTKKAQKMIADGKAQDASKEDGFSLKYKHQFKVTSAQPVYTTREMRADPAPVVEKPAAPVAQAQSAPDPEIDWESHRDDFKAATGALRARKDSVIEWMKSEGRL